MLIVLCQGRQLAGANKMTIELEDLIIQLAENQDPKFAQSLRAIAALKEENKALRHDNAKLVSDLALTGWININDKLPDKGQSVYYYFETCGVNEGHYDGIGIEIKLPCFFGQNGWLCGDVTHWMPRGIPKPPV